MTARKHKQGRMSAQVVEDEDYQLRYEIVAGIVAGIPVRRGVSTVLTLAPGCSPWRLQSAHGYPGSRHGWWRQGRNVAREIRLICVTAREENAAR